jgi:hypothetical protein
VDRLGLGLGELLGCQALQLYPGRDCCLHLSQRFELFSPLTNLILPYAHFAIFYTDPYEYVIKRLVGLEDDVINSCYSNKEIKISKGKCWVEGDNRTNSIDSKNYGPISLGLIIGKATHVIWPPNHWCRLEAQIPDFPDRKIESLGDNNIRITRFLCQDESYWM